MKTSSLGWVALAIGVVLTSTAAGCSSDDDSRTDRIICSAVSGGCSCLQFFIDASSPSVTCDSATYPGTICCAEAGWPSSGHCECSKPSAGCITDDDGTCECGAHVSSLSSTVTTRCTPPSRGICCQSSDGCRCFPSSSSRCSGGKCACAEGESAVTACTAPAATCDTGTANVASCSTGGSVTSSSTGSSGSGATSSSSGSGSTCEPNTDYCSTTSDCKCGATCFATCASCSSYCGVPCASMSDCDAFRSGYFSKCFVNTTGKGRCVQ